MSRSMLHRSLRTRLFLSYLVVVATGAIAMVVVGTVVTRTVYERRIGGVGDRRQQGRGPAEAVVTEGQLQTVLDESLVPALLVGTAAALAAAGVVAWFVGRRLLRPLDEVRAATRQMAAGDYLVTVPTPAETELASLAADVNALGEHLAATEQRRTQLLGEVTHELRTPITMIQGQMEGMLDGVITPSDDVFAGVAGEASRMHRLVDDLATLSRAEEGLLGLHLTDVDLADLATGAVDRLRPQFAHADVQLSAASAGPVPVIADADRVTQIVTNLVGNALGHTSPGGAVTVRVGTTGATAVVDVVDDGDGIPAAELDRIFERFYRLPGSAHRAGRGLGLTIARSLARAHGGDVTAHSDGPGRGATFRLSLPRAS